MSISSIGSQSSSSSWEEILSGSRTENSSKKDDDLATKLFQDLDTDQNGGIGFKESGLSQSQFDALDTDQDGTVSLAELQAGLEIQRQAFFTSMKMENSQNASTTSTEETAQSQAQSMLSAIMNGKPLPPPPGGSDKEDDLASKIFANLDADKSGGLDVAESGLSQSTFDEMDADQNGVVSMEELSAALEKKKAMFASGQNPSVKSEQLSSEATSSGILNETGDTNAQHLLNTIANAVYRGMVDQGTDQGQGFDVTA